MKYTVKQNIKTRIISLMSLIKSHPFFFLLVIIFKYNWIILLFIPEKKPTGFIQFYFYQLLSLTILKNIVMGDRDQIQLYSFFKI